MKKYLTILISLFMTSYGFSQNSPWTRTNVNVKSSNVISTKANLPTNILFKLDLQNFKKAIEGSPLRGKSSNSSVIIDFPNVNGQLESFRVFEAPVLHADISAKYPGIKSYAGQGVDNPTDRIRFSVSPNGLQTMLLSERGAIFIEPISTDGIIYAVYAKSDKSPTSERFKCLVDKNTPNLTGQASGNMKNADDGTLRTFRLAVSTTGEYTQFHGGTKVGALAAINTTMTRVNGIFENDFAVTMVVIGNTDDVIYTNTSSDPYSNGDFSSQLQSTLTSVIGEANYDIGHLFAKADDNGSAGCIGCVCKNGSKGSGFTSKESPIGDAFDVDYVAHEMGHQFGGNHTFTHSDEGNAVQVEPGSGTTIMGYAGITGATDVQQKGDPYFHAASIQQITDYIKSTSCQTNTSTGNAIPTANAGADYMVPKGTPFVLTGQGSDANSGDVLTYCWEQMDGRVATYPSVTATSGVAFRSFNPTTSNQRYFPRLSTIKTGATSWQWEAIPNVTRTLNFRLTVRDNRAGGAGNESDDMKVNVTADAGPFLVSSPNTNVTWQVGSAQTITWDVAGTTGNGINTANVDILLSTDGGNTYTTALATGVTNDGSHTITVPNALGTQNRIMVKGSGNVFFDISNADFEISGQAAPDTQAPSVPASLVTSNATQNTIDLAWNAATDNTAVTGYDVYQGNFVMATITTTSYQATGLTAGTSYSFRVKAKDAAGNVSGFSNTANATTLPVNTSDTQAPSVPTSLVTSNATQNTIDLAWNAATDNTAVTGYDVYQGNFVMATITTTSYQATGLTAGTSYSFRVKAKDAVGNVSGFSNTANATTLPVNTVDTQAPSVPASLVTSNATQNTIDLAWNAATDNTAVTGYDVYQVSTEGSTVVTTVATTSYQATGLTAGTSYFFRVKAKDAAGNESGFSNTATASTLTSGNTCTNVTLTIKFDNFPEETSWQITNSSNQVVASGGPYGSQVSGSIVTVNECLDLGSYTFTINDAFEDGICCSEGNGYYSLTAGDTILASGGSFGTTEATTFSIGGTTKGPEVESFVTTKQATISVYPNPVSNILQIAAAKSDINFSIHDISGRTVSQGKAINKTIDFSSFNSGLYIVKLKVQGKTSVFKISKN